MAQQFGALPLIQFTIEDLQDPAGIERVLLQVQGQMQQIQQSVPPPLDINSLAQQLWPLFQQQLQAVIQQLIQRGPTTPALLKGTR